MNYKEHFVNKIVAFVIFIWTVLLLAAGTVIVYQDYSYALVLAKNEAVVSVKKIWHIVRG